MISRKAKALFGLLKDKKSHRFMIQFGCKKIFLRIENEGKELKVREGEYHLMNLLERRKNFSIENRMNERIKGELKIEVHS